VLLVLQLFFDSMFFRSTIILSYLGSDSIKKEDPKAVINPYLFLIDYMIYF
jgi:hypothetical protein